MKRLFLDVTSSNYDGADGAICVIRKDAEIIQAGTTISSMPTELMDEEYQKFIDCYDIHFIFDNMALNVDFYAVKSRLLCKMLYNVFTISTYQN